jgi:dihydroorotate dehydrogenase electron transfer subunit
LNQVEAIVVSNDRFFADSAYPNTRIAATQLMWLDCPQIAAEARPGQFVMVRCGDLTLPRPFSIHQSRQDGIAILYSVFSEGKGTSWLAKRRADDRLTVLGPLGNGFTIDRSKGRLLLVAGGIGVAPLCFLAQVAAERALPATLLLGAQTGSLIYPRRLLPPGLEVVMATDDGSAGHHGPVTDLIREHSGEASQIFACGPPAMYRGMASLLGSPGLAGRSIQISLEAVMACGHGACYGCTVRTSRGLRQVCRDGPVFELEEMVWDGTGVST